MGDSVGPEGLDGSGTLGPMLKISNKVYWLLNWHIFDDRGRNQKWKELRPPPVNAVHPSEDDLRQTQGQQHSRLGNPVAYSGQMYVTSRESKSMARKCAAEGRDHFPKTPRVTTDWVLFEATSESKVNKIRGISIEGRCDSFGKSITETKDPMLPCCIPSKQPTFVCCTARTSGWSAAQICETLAYLNHGNNIETREWSVQAAETESDEWNLGGMGIPGDSGAGIIELLSNKLIGQLWGRNVYHGDKHRITYFTAISDICDDIQDNMPTQDRPKLPCDDAGEVDMNSTRRFSLNSISEDPDDPSGNSHENVNSQAAEHSNTFTIRSSARPSSNTGRCGDIIVHQYINVPHAATF
ncbi:uncharacterized protein BCR38DRAFT_151775 [Pseudomassariella vexata]|uniref:Uncharacterized protein n=1 Tax=Pseudomassariella vexata TaxID=1141098 RepID=A0A1Y2E6D6_9PEZI|nr:uncharacterized protein BCR38DRAFT_151775 [Pseudomassariella vexata]ORY67130.1 hypothetical protein BCR38DRAFT_151775 [Pseudomassariella vexata]